MTDELVDIINEKDEVIGQITKSQAHLRGLLHRCVISEVIDSSGRWMLVKQANNRQDPGQYVSPVGGHVQAGEANDNALKREATEELNIRDYDYLYVGKAIYTRNVIGRQENHLFIVYKIFTDQEPELNHESVSFRRFTPFELTKKMMSTPLSFGDAWWFIVKRFFRDLL